MKYTEKISSEIGLISLLCAGLFFICQILSIDTGINKAYASINIISSTSPAPVLNVEMLKTYATEIEKGTKDVLLVAAEISNPGSQSVILSDVYIYGNYSSMNETNTVLYVDDNVNNIRWGAPGLIRDDVVGYNKMNLKISAGQSVSLTLRGDIPGTNVQTPLTYYFSANIAAYDLSGSRAKINMIGGANASMLNIREKGSDSLSSLNVEILSENINVDKGGKNMQLQKMNLKNYRDSVSVIRIIDFDIINSGSYLNDVNLDAAYLYLGDKLLAVGSVKGNKILFDTAVSLSAGESNSLVLKGDISEKATAQMLSFKMNWDYYAYYGGMKIYTPVNMAGNPSVVTIPQTSPSAAIDYDISGSFVVTDFDYNPQNTKVFGQVSSDGQIYYAKFDGTSDNGYSASSRYCGYDGQSHNYSNGWAIDRKYVSNAKYIITVNGHSKPDCGIGQPQNTGWFRINPDSGWKITEETRCFVSEDNNSNGKIIDTYCKVNKETGEVRWQSGSLCGGCCACGDGAPVHIEMVVEKSSSDVISAPAGRCEIQSDAIKEGAMIRAKGGIDVYIVKYANCKKFKRLILSPSVFRSYGHLKWGDIIEVDQAVLDSYATSNYVRVLRENAIWELEPRGDNGIKKRIMNIYRWDEEVWGWSYKFDPDSIYEINETDRDSYAEEQANISG